MQQPVARIALPGLSVQPADVQGWIPTAPELTLITIGRQTGGPEEATVMQAGVDKEDPATTQDQFLAAWKALEDRDISKDEYSVQDHTVTALQWKGAACLRSSIMLLDYRPHASPGEPNPMRRFEETLACQHPQDHGVVVFVRYIRQQTANEVDAAFTHELEALFDSIEFTPLVDTTARDTVLRTYPALTASGEEAVRLGGKGNNLASKIMCIPGGDGCTLFGSSSGIFAKQPQFWITHLGPDDKVRWSEALGGGAGDVILTAAATRDGGDIVVGQSASRYQSDQALFPAHTRPRPVFMRLDPTGKILWAGSIELGDDVAVARLHRVYQTADGGFLLVGGYGEGNPPPVTEPSSARWTAEMLDEQADDLSPFLVKLSADGKPLWIRRYKIDGYGSLATAVTEMPSGHLVLTGPLYYAATRSLFILETDSQGAPLHAIAGMARRQLRGLPGDARVLSEFFLRLADGRYVDVGEIGLDHGIPGVYVFFLTPDLKPFGGTLYSEPHGILALGAVQGADGKLCIVGQTEDDVSHHGEGVAWLIDDHWNDVRELWLPGAGDTRLTSGLAQKDGSYRLFGDTEVFGASGRDQLLATWKPAKDSSDAKRLSRGEFFSSWPAVEASSTTARLDMIQAILPSAFRVTRFEAGQPKPH